MPKLTPERAAAGLALVGIVLAWDSDFEAWRVNYAHGTDATADYCPDLPDAWETGRDMAAALSRRAATYRAAFGGPPPAAVAAALATLGA